MVRIPLIALALACSSLQAADVYVWVDESGRRQISDVVPEKDRARAKKIEVPAGEARSAAAGGTAAPAEGPVTQAPAATDCQARWQLYRDSRECVAFYEYALRGLEADPHANCPVVPAPGCTLR
ncbi:MAG: hypothetical protein QOD26_1979 [Betaproteobacteria bacterium]|jgi:hypothetical protein|nr:hypothetical protein [Betaproteobacteria bacterium]